MKAAPVFVRRGVAAAIVATALTELIGSVFAWPIVIFLPPLQTVLGGGAIVGGLLFRGILIGALYALVEPRLPGGAAVKGLTVAVAVRLVVAAAAFTAGDGVLQRLAQDPLGQIIPVLVYGLILGRAFRLFSPEEWRPQTASPDRAA
jgi:hypothetical protein